MYCQKTQTKLWSSIITRYHHHTSQFTINIYVQRSLIMRSPTFISPSVCFVFVDNGCGVLQMMQHVDAGSLRLKQVLRGTAHRANNTLHGIRKPMTGSFLPQSFGNSDVCLVGVHSCFKYQQRPPGFADPQDSCRPIRTMPSNQDRMQTSVDVT